MTQMVIVIQFMLLHVISPLQGALVEAVRKGWWVLLDEVNLASPEALQCLNCLLEGPQGTFLLTEKLLAITHT